MEGALTTCMKAASNSPRPSRAATVPCSGMEKHPTGIPTKIGYVNHETEVSEQVIAGGGDTLGISWTKLCPVDGF